MMIAAFSAVVLLFVPVYFLLRYTTRMSSFVGWVQYYILGRNSKDTAAEVPQDKTEADDPVFSTNLETPIEDILKETVEEDLSSQPSTSKKKEIQKKSGSKQENKQSPCEKDKGKKDSPLIVISPENKKSEKHSKKKKQKSDVSGIDKAGNQESELLVDSFVLVKDKNKSKKKVNRDSKESIKENTNIDQNVRKGKEFSPKPSDVEKYKSKISKESSSRGILSKTNLNIERVKNEGQKWDTNQQKSETRESKKVSNSISFASVVTNTVESIDIDVDKLDDTKNNGNTKDIQLSSEQVKCVIEPGFNKPIASEVEEEKTITFKENHTTHIQLSSEPVTTKVDPEFNTDIASEVESEKAITFKENHTTDIQLSSEQATSEVDPEFHTHIASEADDEKAITFNESHTTDIERSSKQVTCIVESDFNTHITSEVENPKTITFKESQFNLGQFENQIVSENTFTLDKSLTKTNSSSSIEVLSEGPNTFDDSVLEQSFCIENQPEDGSVLSSQRTKKIDESVLNEPIDEYFIEDLENIKAFKDGFNNKRGCNTFNLSSGIAFLGKTRKIMASSQIRVLTLNNQEHQECTLYRIQKNWTIQFRLGPSLFGRKLYLYCNYPVENNDNLIEFDRQKYQLLDWVWDEGCKNADDTAAYTEITPKIAGSFHYFFTFEQGENAERQGSGFFLVDPVLKYGNDEVLPLDCVQCQTVLTKCLGSFSTWEKKLQVARESGYNAIHFTPIQELGGSNSSYSLSNQLALNQTLVLENGKMPTFEEVEQLIIKIRKEWKMVSICDIVLNHTANESEWIKEHTEATYNCSNCPYLRPAYLLDAAFHIFSMDVKSGFYEDRGIPAIVENEDHLNAIRYHFRLSVMDPLKIYELFLCDTKQLVAEFIRIARTTQPVMRNVTNKEQEDLKIIQDEEYKRLGSTVDLKLALQRYNVYRSDTYDEDTRLRRCTEDFKNKLDSLNNSIKEEIESHLTAAIENVISGIRYERVNPDGPKLKEITTENPLVKRYFTDYETLNTVEEYEEMMYGINSRFLMAHNGWVMNCDPLVNFAAPGTKVYIRRELLVWGDSVKLKFGDKPEDCPFLWEHMRKYVEQTAKIFDGVRLDNCHSTPIHVAEYLLDCARRIRPDLYVIAELFTNSDMKDNIFVNRLGITSLIREAMAAGDSHEEGRLVYRYGGSPVGSFYHSRVRPLVPSIAHALFLDLTHDNPSPVQKRSVFDLLPSTAVVNMACCASGSNRGYDELVPQQIHVVTDNRQYAEWTDNKDLALNNLRYVSSGSGIISAKRALNDLHFILGKEGYNQVFVDQIDGDIVAITRHHPDTHESYILVAFTAFNHPSADAAYYQRGIRPLRFQGVLDEIVLEATITHVNSKNDSSRYAKWENFVRDDAWINGLSEYQVTLKQHIQINESDVFEQVDSGTPNYTQLSYKNFKPGSVVIVKTSLPKSMSDAVKTVRSLIRQFSLRKETELSRIIEKLTLADLNRILYRCDQEEQDEGFGFGTYNVPNFGPLVYAGLQGIISHLAHIRPSNDLGHPICNNLRDGNWMIDYIWKRLKLDVGTKELGQWIEENTKCFNEIPRYLIPCYFDAVITGLYILLIEQSYALKSKFVNHGSKFVKGLSLGSVQCGAYIKSANLPVLSPNLTPPKPPTRENEKGETVQACVTLSAGLPHFSVGYMRNWGRDTFISLRGLFILTGRFEESRQHILGYAACLRHGLIPNLLDGGHNPRFNCRDAVWWWLYAIKGYVEEAPNGINILNDKVSRLFPKDDSPAQPPGAIDQPLCDVMQEALTVHFQGLAFRERNAGRAIDEHMTDTGFNNQIGVHPETGFVFGGNNWNCGTWMDKMGSSDKAGNRGLPATPRDGSAIEIVGLSKAVVTWLWKLNQEGKFPYEGVQRTHAKRSTITKWTYKKWGDIIQANFEKYFWVNTTSVPGESSYVNKRGIYKDSYGTTTGWADFQLRCNFPIAMVVAPELFTPQQAWTALNQAEKYLLGPLGMKTLDPDDMAYRGDYDNSNDSNDKSVAHGFNYHQGPEWLWPVGYFLRAKLQFAESNGVLAETLSSTKVILSRHFTELTTSIWRGLPELTNSNGSYCKDSSRTQAWSMACILEVLYDLQKIESNQPVLIN